MKPTASGKGPTDTDGDSMTQQDHEDEPAEQNGDEHDEGSAVDRRAVVNGILAGVVGLLGFGVGRADAQTSANRVGTPTNPYEISYTDSVVLHDLGSDPSSPDDGTLFYNSGA